MSRAKKIDENTILDAAEEVIREKGAAGLTIETVARKTQVSVGGMQGRRYRRNVRKMGPRIPADIAALYPPPVDALDEVRRDIVFDFKQSVTAKKTAASIIAALQQSPEHTAS